jgi:hypothetical protein
LHVDCTFRQSGEIFDIAEKVDALVALVRRVQRRPHGGPIDDRNSGSVAYQFIRNCLG